MNLYILKMHEVSPIEQWRVVILNFKLGSLSEVGTTRVTWQVGRSGRGKFLCTFPFNIGFILILLLLLF